MKTLTKIALLTAALTLSTAASAAPKSDSANLADCKASVHAQFDQIERIDVASMTSRRNLFKAKMRVKTADSRALVACEIRGDQPLALNCIKGDSCKVDSVASS